MGHGCIRRSSPSKIRAPNISTSSWTSGRVGPRTRHGGYSASRVGVDPEFFVLDGGANGLDWTATVRGFSFSRGELPQPPSNDLQQSRLRATSNGPLFEGSSNLEPSDCTGNGQPLRNRGAERLHDMQALPRIMPPPCARAGLRTRFFKAPNRAPVLSPGVAKFVEQNSWRRVAADFRRSR